MDAYVIQIENAAGKRLKITASEREVEQHDGDQASVERMLKIKFEHLLRVFEGTATPEKVA